MAGYQGDIHLGDTIDIKFCTVQTTGAPFTLAGTPVISAYIGNSTTQITAGITLSVDFDGVTGLNNVRVVASGGNGYDAATNVSLIITTGTVNSVSVVGYEVGSFSIDCRGVNQILGTAVSTPATAGILDVNVKNMNNVAATSVTTINANQGTTQPLNFTGTAGSALVKGDMVDIAGAAVSTSTAQLGVNVVNFGGSAGTFASGRPEVNTTHIKGTSSVGTAGYVAPDFTTTTIPLGIVTALGWVDNGTLQSATATGCVIRSAASFGDNILSGHTIWITGGTGIGQSSLITSNVGSTDTLVVAPGWITTPDNTSTYAIYPTPPGNTGTPIRTGLAQAGAATTITLDSGASATNSFYNNDLVVLTGGTGAGQSRFITAYVGATKVATVATWVTNPDSTSTFAIIPFDAVAGATAPTVAQIATGVWQDTTSGDFTVASSIGKSLFTSGVVPGGSGGLLISGSNSGTTTLGALTVTGVTTHTGATVHTGNVSMAAGLNITQSSSNTSALVVTGNGTGSGAVITSGSGATGDGIQATAASTAGNGMVLTKTSTGLALKGATTDLTLAKTTNITGFNDIAATAIVSSGAITTSGGAVSTVTTTTTATNLTNAPTVGDFTATMKTSIGTAVAASAVASVTGNVGGNVTGSVGSVVGAVGSVTGSVGSVTGAVGSVTGNVGGNVTGSVGSVVGAVGSVTAKVDVGKINGTTVSGTGVLGDEWGP